MYKKDRGLEWKWNNNKTALLEKAAERLYNKILCSETISQKQLPIKISGVKIVTDQKWVVEQLIQGNVSDIIWVPIVKEPNCFEACKSLGRFFFQLHKHNRYDQHEGSKQGWEVAVYRNTYVGSISFTIVLWLRLLEIFLSFFPLINTCTFVVSVHDGSYMTTSFDRVCRK